MASGHGKKHSIGDLDNHTVGTVTELNALLSDGNIAVEGVNGVSSNNVYVATNGDNTSGDGSYNNPYLTIEYALSTITDSSDSNRYAINIASGSYTENNPLVLKDGIHLYGVGGTASVRIVANNPTSNLINIVPRSGIVTATLSGTTEGWGAYFNGAGIATLRDIQILNCGKGICVEGQNSTMDIQKVWSQNDDSIATSGLIEVIDGKAAVSNVLIPTGTFTDVIHLSGPNALVFVSNFGTNTNNVENAIHIEGGADVTINGGRITGDLGDRIGSAIKIQGDNSHCDMLATYIQHADYGIHIMDDSQLDAAGVIIDTCDQGVHMGLSGSPVVNYMGGSIQESLTWHLHLENENAKLLGNTRVDENQIYLNGANVVLVHIADNEGDEGFAIKGELHVGSPENGRESVMGEGDSYVRGMLAYTYNESTSAYVDVSLSAASPSSSTFTFPNNVVDSAIYLSSDLTVASLSDYHKYFGIKMSLDTPQTGGEIIGEYYAGVTSGWVEFTHMTCQTSGKYYRKSDALFTNDAGSYQVRFNPAMDNDWVANDPPSVDANDRYWIRFRINSSPSVLPVFEQFKLHANRTEINADGYLEYMGNARPYISISTNWNNFKDTTTSLANQDLWRSTNCNTGLDNNNFNTNGDSVGTITAIPSWADTSAPIRVLAAITSSSTGNLTMTAYLNNSAEGDTISTTNPASTVGEISDIVTKSVTAGQQEWFEFELDISNLGTQADGTYPDLLWLNLEATTRPGNIYGMAFYTSVLKWRDGDHI